MSAVAAWQRLAPDAALDVLAAWAGRRVIVSVDLAAGPPGLVGAAGVLRACAGGRQFELEGAESWLQLPAGPALRGATYDGEEAVLVLELAGEDPAAAPAVLLDVQLLAAAPE